MEPQNQELQSFFENTQQALKKVPLKELNSALVNLIKEKGETIGEIEKERVEKVLDLVAEEYSISKRTLQKSTARGNVQVARKMAYCLLHFDVGLNTRYIAKKIFDKWQNSVSVAIQFYKRLDVKIPADKKFLNTYERLQLKITAK